MNAWTFGPFVLTSSMLIIVAAIAVGYAVMRFRLQNALPAGSSYDRAFEVVLIWLLVWKLSIVLFNPQGVIDNPMTLLYYSGGSKGAWIAVLLAAGYVWYKDRKSPYKAVYIDAWLISIIAGYTTYRLLAAVVQDGHAVTNGAAVAIGIATIVLWWIREPQAGRKTMHAVFISFVIAHALLSSLAMSTWEKSAGAVAQDAEGTPVGIGIGQRAPDFELLTLDGQKVKLSDFRGKKVLINFWATWCPPCRIEMPIMQQFYSQQKDNNVVILSVDATHTELNSSIVESFVNHWGLTFPVVLDADGQVGKTYQVAAYPATYTLDENGIIRKKHQGAMDEEMLKKAIR
ncbi:redoxin domain-containing protein [Paenibacillus sp. NPDC056579]|uniref:redoxin domain-containing protein n=1 Tax=Paenibacillus sp. NPDC056579 TaxID=3345871 RepID=UPI00368ABB5F